jgi:hypothetical protein
MRSAATNRGSAFPIAMDTQTIPMWACARLARDYLGVSEKTLARWRDSGLLKAGRKKLLDCPLLRYACHLWTARHYCNCLTDHLEGYLS